MSTRSCIGRAKPSDRNPLVRYHHWDGYPSGLGATLYDLYRNQFHRDLDAMLKVLIDDHPAGWSTINGKDFDLEPAFEEHGNGRCATCGLPFSVHYKQYYGDDKIPLPRWASKLPTYLLANHQPLTEKGQQPECYCHGDRSETQDKPLTLSQAPSYGCEYAYVIDPETKIMRVLSSYSEDGTKMIGMFGMGDEDAEWRLLAEVDLDGPEPNWGKMNG